MKMSFIPVKLCLRLHLLKGINWRLISALKKRDVWTPTRLAGGGK